MTVFVNPENKSQTGHTLTEMLVALTIMSLLSTFLFSGLQWSSRAWRIAQEASENERVDASYALLRRTLESTFIKFEIGRDGYRSPTFLGKHETIIFTGSAPTLIDTPGVYRLQFSTLRQDNNNGLYLKRIIYRTHLQNNATFLDDDINLLVNAEPLLLIKDVDKLTFSYYGSIKEGAPMIWHNEWNNPETLPNRIQVKLSFPDGDKRNWPVLIVTPRIMR